MLVGEALKSAMLEQPEGSGLWTLKAAAGMCTHFTQHVDANPRADTAPCFFPTY